MGIVKKMAQEFCCLLCLCVATESVLEGGPEHSEVGGVPLSESGGP